jgi:hypothetical protein
VTDAIHQPEKESYLFVELRHGDSQATVERYTDWQRDVSGFKSTPLMEVDIQPNGGEFVEREHKIVLPLDQFTDRLSDGLPHSPVYVKVEERTAGLIAGQAGIILTLLRGQVKRVVRNYQRRRNMVAIQVLPIKSRLDIPLGLQVNTQDEARLFGPMSGLVQSSFEELGQIASLNGRVATISANAAIETPTAPGGTNDRFWERGWLEKDGLKINVLTWNRLSDPKVFVLRDRPPANWVLAGASSILFVPGTHGTIEDARDVWDDEEHFLGLGYGMLGYNPLYERSRSDSRTKVEGITL